MDKTQGPDFTDEIHLPAVIAANERTARARFWPKLRRTAGRIPFAEELATAYYCALDPTTPTRVRGVLLAALAYFVLPADMIPDILAGLGFTDDASVAMAALSIVAAHVRPGHKAKARQALGLPALAED